MMARTPTISKRGISLYDAPLLEENHTYVTNEQVTNEFSTNDFSTTEDVSNSFNDLRTTQNVSNSYNDLTTTEKVTNGFNDLRTTEAVTNSFNTTQQEYVTRNEYITNTYPVTEQITNQYITNNPITQIRPTVALDAQATAAQAPSAVNTAVNVNFGPAVDNQLVSMTATGAITVKRAGYYELDFQFLVNRAVLLGTVTMHFRVLINNLQRGITRSITLDNINATLPLIFSMEDYLNVNDVVQVQLVRDGGGINLGGLVSILPGLSSFSRCPAAYIRMVHFSNITAPTAAPV